MKRLGLKFLLWFNASLLVAVLLVCMSVVWLVKSESGLSFVAQQAPTLISTFLGQKVNIEQTKGSLWDGFSLKTVQFDRADIEVIANDVTVKVVWPDLMKDTLTIEQLSAASLSIQTLGPQKESTEPVQMPESIKLPLALDLKKVELGRLILNKDQFSGIGLSAIVAQQTFDLSNLQVSHRGAKLHAAGNASLDQPFPLSLKLQVSRDLDQELMLAADASMTGSLDRLELDVHALGRYSDRPKIQQELKAHVVAAPFERAILKTVNATAKGFDPSKWLEGAPEANLSFKADLTPNKDFSKSQGRIELVNTRPLALQDGGIPVSELLAKYTVELENNQPERAQIEINRLQVKTKDQRAGDAKGLLRWTRETQGLKDGVSEWGNLEFDLNGSGLRLKAFTPNDRGAILDWTVQGKKVGNQLILDGVAVKDRGGVFTAEGVLQLTGQVKSQFTVSTKNLNPGIYVDNPELRGSLTGGVNWEGVLGVNGILGAITPEGKLSARFAQSKIGGAPFSLVSEISGNLNRAERFNLDLDVLGNTLAAFGSYGGPGDSFELKIKADQLATLGKAVNQNIRGQFSLDGRLSGYASDLNARLKIQATQLRLADALGVESVDGLLEFGFKPDSVWRGDANLVGFSRPNSKNKILKNLKLEVSGTTAAHQVDLSFLSDQYPFSRRRSIGAEMSLAGGLNNLFTQDSHINWNGTLRSLTVEGIWRPVRSLTLEKPVGLFVSGDRIRISEFNLRGEDDTLVNSQNVSWSNGELKLEGRAPWLALPRLGSVLKQPLTLETDHLVTALNWRVTSSSKALDGHVDLRYLSGGFSILEDAEIEVPVKALDLAVDFSRERMTMGLNLDATQIGVVAAELSLPVQKDPSTLQWGIAVDQPMSGSLAAGLTDLSWLGPLISPAVRTQGDGQISLAVSGSPGKPELEGRLFAREFNVTELDQGVRLEDGDVVVDFNNDRAKIEKLEFTVYHRQAPARRIEELGPLIQGVGKVTASGQWNLDGLGGGVELKMDRVGLIQHPERWLMLSADISVKQPVEAEKPILVRGDVLAHGAYIELPESQPQTLGSDVVIRGGIQSSSESMPIDVLINAKLGDLFFLNAEGLKARLAGGMRLLVQDGVRTADGRTGRRLEATGTIQTAEGTYRAYGQDLTIERGVVNFQGPLNNPGLNVRAVRKGVAVEAGVEITGSANRPQVTLVSDPPVPDSEKLSWMIIGRGSNSSDRDTTLLLTAAAAIFGDSDDSTTQKVAKSLGIDDFALSSGSLTAADSRAVGSQVSISPGADASASILGDEDPLLTQRLITLGKRLSQRLYLNFEQSVTTSANVVKLTYQYSRRLSFIARGGADNAVDALYQFSFD